MIKYGLVDIKVQITYFVNCCVFFKELIEKKNWSIFFSFRL